MITQAIRQPTPAVPGDQGAAAHHPQAESCPLALAGHLQLGELQLVADKHRDLLRELLDQFSRRAVLGRDLLDSGGAFHVRPSVC
jgi:hypothetical protein